MKLQHQVRTALQPLRSKMETELYRHIQLQLQVPEAKKKKKKVKQVHKHKQVKVPPTSVTVSNLLQGFVNSIDYKFDDNQDKDIINCKNNINLDKFKQLSMVESVDQIQGQLSLMKDLFQTVDLPLAVKLISTITREMKHLRVKCAKMEQDHKEMSQEQVKCAGVGTRDLDGCEKDIDANHNQVEGFGS